MIGPETLLVSLYGPWTRSRPARWLSTPAGCGSSPRASLTSCLYSPRRAFGDAKTIGNLAIGQAPADLPKGCLLPRRQLQLRGMGFRPLLEDPRQGRIFLALASGDRFESRNQAAGAETFVP